jgi:hypothetical protein
MLAKPEAAFLEVLPLGRDNALTAKEIGGLMMQHLRYTPSERVVRQIASDLRRRGRLIASSPTPPYGFYRPADLAEAEECREQLARRLREVRRTVAAYDRAVSRMKWREKAPINSLPGMEQGA